MDQISATIILDSINPNGNRLTTFELEYPRFIHSEVMTHRAFSRNAASSRAIPISTVIEQVRTNPAAPIHWGANQSGMQAKQELVDRDLQLAKLLWRNAANSAADTAEVLSLVGGHKQFVNRILEPFVLIKVVLTATEYDNFFELRDHSDAQPEIWELAKLMRSAMDKSTPNLLHLGEWHTPYADPSLPLDDRLKVSASCCAQVSYRKLDDSIDKAYMVYDRLVGSRPLHCYDKDTEVLTQEGFKYFRDLTSVDKVLSVDKRTLNIIGFEVPSEIQAGLHTGKMFSVDNSAVSMRVTNGHIVIASTVCGYKDRSNPVFTAFEADAPAVGRSKKEYRILQESNLPVVCNVQLSNDRYLQNKGKFIGMYIGDGFKIDNTIGFHFKKERKVDYLTSVLDDMQLLYSSNVNADGTVSIRVYKCELTTEILDTCRFGTKERELGNGTCCCTHLFLRGLKTQMAVLNVVHGRIPL